jgi:hypothetical protein
LPPIVTPICASSPAACTAVVTSSTPLGRPLSGEGCSPVVADEVGSGRSALVVPIPGAPSRTARGRGSAAGGVATPAARAPAPAGRGDERSEAESAAPAALSAAGVGSNVRGAAALRRVAVARAVEAFFAVDPDGFLAVAAAFGFAVVAAAVGVAAPDGFVAAARRVPIRSGRVDGSAASTPFSSFLGFALDFFGFSTLSAMPSRVYGSRTGRGARPPSYRHKIKFAAPSYCSGPLSRAPTIDDLFGSS